MIVNKLKGLQVDKESFQKIVAAIVSYPFQLVNLATLLPSINYQLSTYQKILPPSQPKTAVTLL